MDRLLLGYAAVMVCLGYVLFMAVRKAVATIGENVKDSAWEWAQTALYVVMFMSDMYTLAAHNLSGLLALYGPMGMCFVILAGNVLKADRKLPWLALWMTTLGFVLHAEAFALLSTTGNPIDGAIQVCIATAGTLATLYRHHRAKRVARP
ncbi:MAG TPA: hypothetical protein VLG40_04225 [Candidatus Saccharimonas sp.]|nr:hypothetical protein [Candidatus Saccharimonas sp.]